LRNHLPGFRFLLVAPLLTLPFGCCLPAVPAPLCPFNSASSLSRNLVLDLRVDRCELVIVNVCSGERVA